jgi:hypothetical protein
MTARGKGRFLRRIAGALVCALAGLLGSCENPYVQEILRGPAVLDNLALVAGEGVRYKLDPDFNDDILEYAVSVPFPTARIRLEGFDHRDAEITYSISLDGETWEAETGDGGFEFDNELYIEGGYVKIRVNRKYMDEQVYTVYVKRATDDLLWDLRVRRYAATDDTNDTTEMRSPEDIKRWFAPLSPGYDPAKYWEEDGGKFEYTVRVNHTVEDLRLWSRRKPGVSASYRIQRPGGGDWEAWTPIPETSRNGELIDFPLARQWVKIGIHVELDGFPSRDYGSGRCIPTK